MNVRALVLLVGVVGCAGSQTHEAREAADADHALQAAAARCELSQRHREHRRRVCIDIMNGRVEVRCTGNLDPDEERCVVEAAQVYAARRPRVSLGFYWNWGYEDVCPHPKGTGIPGPACSDLAVCTSLCESKVIEACRTQGAMLASGWAGRPDVDAARRAYWNECELGTARDCVNFALLRPEEACATALLQAACAQGAERACGRP